MANEMRATPVIIGNALFLPFSFMPMLPPLRKNCYAVMKVNFMLLIQEVHFAVICNADKRIPFCSWSLSSGIIFIRITIAWVLLTIDEDVSSMLFIKHDRIDLQAFCLAKDTFSTACYTYLFDATSAAGS